MVRLPWARVSLRTIRYYEESGLLPPSSYTSGGLRLYTAKDVNRLIFIRRLKTLGLSIEEVHLCLGELPEASSRRARVKHTLKLLHMQKQKAREEREKLATLEQEIDSSLETVNKCVSCAAKQCPVVPAAAAILLSQTAPARYQATARLS